MWHVRDVDRKGGSIVLVEGYERGCWVFAVCSLLFAVCSLQFAFGRLLGLEGNVLIKHRDWVRLGVGLGRPSVVWVQTLDRDLDLLEIVLGRDKAWDKARRFRAR